MICVDNNGPSQYEPASHVQYDAVFGKSETCEEVGGRQAQGRYNREIIADSLQMGLLHTHARLSAKSVWGVSKKKNDMELHVTV